MELNREDYIKRLLKENKIQLKKDSESIYYDLSDLKDKKWFELSDLMKNKYINDLISVYIVNSKKGIGKTYQLRKKMEEAENENKLFGFVRRTIEEIKSQKDDWETMENWNYYIKGKSIINKLTGKKVGMITTISTLYSQTGREFSNYKYLFFDEFKDKRGIGRYIDGEFNKFCKFLMDFQRNKEDIKVFMFCNNETNHDPYTTGLRIDPTTDYFIDLDLGVFYLNCMDLYKGAINKDTTIGYRLAKYDNQLLNEIQSNVAVYADEENLISFKQGYDIGELKYQFYLNKKLYSYYLAKNAQKMVIRSDNKNRTPLIYSLTTNDVINFTNTIQPADIKSMCRSWRSLLNSKLLCFIDYSDKLEIEAFISKVIGNIVKGNNV